ncbi:hypothetical protein TNCV_589731 [Trichonephila clavipes]|nr:hypothetical protein TNCV_589731 [Trichonephila clavipes]
MKVNNEGCYSFNVSEQKNILVGRIGRNSDEEAQDYSLEQWHLRPAASVVKMRQNEKLKKKSTYYFLYRRSRIFNQHLISSATLRRFINSKASRRSCIIMPPKRRAIGRSTPQARKRRALRASE